MFTNQDLKKLIIPLFLEQLLVALVGIADVFVIGFVGEAAVSGVSLVNAFKGRLKLPENDPLFLTTEKLLGKGDFWGKRDYFGALKIMPGYGKMDSEKQQKEDMTEDE